MHDVLAYSWRGVRVHTNVSMQFRTEHTAGLEIREISSAI